MIAARAVPAVIDMAKEGLVLSAQLDTLTNGFNALTKDVDAETLSLDTLRKATRNTVSDVELLQSANVALALGLPIEGLNDLYDAAMSVGNAMGLTTAQAVSDLTRGIGRQSNMILDNLGIVVDTEAAYEAWAEELGTTADKLSDSERKTAFMTAAIEALMEKQAALGETTSETQLALEAWDAWVVNTKTSLGALAGELVLTAQNLKDSWLVEVASAIKAQTDWNAVINQGKDSFTASIPAYDLVDEHLATISGDIRVLIDDWLGLDNATNQHIETINAYFEDLENLGEGLENFGYDLSELTRRVNNFTHETNESLKDSLDWLYEFSDELEAAEQSGKTTGGEGEETTTGGGDKGKGDIDTDLIPDPLSDKAIHPEWTKGVHIPIGPGYFEGTFAEFVPWVKKWWKEVKEWQILAYWNQASNKFISAQSGFRGLVTEPTMFLAGERGAEMVNITPTGGSGGLGGGNVTFNINRALPFPDDPVQLRELAELLWSMEVREYRALGYR
jgi:hypothetical protein